ncbi:enoyl-CoA hydratase [Nocardia sp. alder85J]|uniref:enoyl-CoA hydratase n=1 Tax=Nocardia sp. alder85J TaxID=2862949 RepID=UPI001CD5C9A3|nr:enoyl-CoA hydratase [Nocardia sp. alder85J]MCX4095665.1 enoyl-CoA hydratase [Nocardia sp. alder85J]
MITATMRDGVAVITLRRPEKRNALDIPHLNEFTETFSGTLDRGVRTVVVTGEGQCFSAGADLGQVYTSDFREALYRALQAITAASIPVIAAVNGPAIGAGTQLAIACDLRVADVTASFAVPTAKNGLAVDPWTVRRLATLAGGATASAMLLACEIFDVHAAVQRGLADRVGDLDAALRLADELATFAPLSLSYSKRALQRLLEPEARDEHLVALFEECWGSADFAEAQIARVERRTPKFIGK